MTTERVELVTGEHFFSDDHWRTVWRDRTQVGLPPRRVTLRVEIDRVRFIALVQYGGGRDEQRRARR